MTTVYLHSDGYTYDTPQKFGQPSPRRDDVVAYNQSKDQLSYFSGASDEDVQISQLDRVIDSYNQVNKIQQKYELQNMARGETPSKKVYKQGNAYSYDTSGENVDLGKDGSYITNGEKSKKISERSRGQLKNHLLSGLEKNLENIKQAKRMAQATGDMKQVADLSTKEANLSLKISNQQEKQQAEMTAKSQRALSLISKVNPSNLKTITKTVSNITGIPLDENTTAEDLIALGVDIESNMSDSKLAQEARESQLDIQNKKLRNEQNQLDLAESKSGEGKKRANIKTQPKEVNEMLEDTLIKELSVQTGWGDGLSDISATKSSPEFVKARADVTIYQSDFKNAFPNLTNKQHLELAVKASVMSHKRKSGDSDALAYSDEEKNAELERMINDMLKGK